MFWNFGCFHLNVFLTKGPHNFVHTLYSWCFHLSTNLSVSLWLILHFSDVCLVFKLYIPVRYAAHSSTCLWPPVLMTIHYYSAIISFWIKCSIWKHYVMCVSIFCIWNWLCKTCFPNSKMSILYKMLPNYTLKWWIVQSFFSPTLVNSNKTVSYCHFDYMSASCNRTLGHTLQQ
jgi:hypothetical protein